MTYPTRSPSNFSLTRLLECSRAAGTKTKIRDQGSSPVSVVWQVRTTAFLLCMKEPRKVNADLNINNEYHRLSGR